MFHSCTCEFTSYWMYCFLHSGVIWAERCSANFILKKQQSPQRPLIPRATVPCWSEFCYFCQLGLPACVRLRGAVCALPIPCPGKRLPDKPQRPTLPTVSWEGWQRCTTVASLPLTGGLMTKMNTVKIPHWLSPSGVWSSLGTQRSAIAFSKAWLRHCAGTGGGLDRKTPSLISTFSIQNPSAQLFLQS